MRRFKRSERQWDGTGNAVRGYHHDLTGEHDVLRAGNQARLVNQVFAKRQAGSAADLVWSREPVI